MYADLAINYCVLVWLSADASHRSHQHGCYRWRTIKDLLVHLILCHLDLLERKFSDSFLRMRLISVVAEVQVAKEAVQLTHWRIPTKLERYLYTILCYTNTLIQFGRVEFELQTAAIHPSVANEAMSCSHMQFAQHAYKCTL